MLTHPNPVPLLNRPVAATQYIYLAHDEWGGEVMDRVAAERFAEYEFDKELLLLEVHEHAGWFLAYAWIDGKPRCVSSANDAARFSDAVKEWWKRFNNNVGSVWIKSIRRGRVDEATV